MLNGENSLELEMNTTRMIEKMDAIISRTLVALIIGTGAFFAVLLARTLRRASVRHNSSLDISNIHLLSGQESPQNSAMRLNAIWMREQSQA